MADLGVAHGDPVKVVRRKVADWTVYRDGQLVLGRFSIAAAESAQSS